MNINTRTPRNERDFPTPTNPQGKLRPLPSTPDLSSFRIIFPSTTDSKRDELYAYLLAYNYLTSLPKPLSSTRGAATRSRLRGGRKEDNRGGGLGSPFSSKTEIRNGLVLGDGGRKDSVIDYYDAFPTGGGVGGGGGGCGGGFPDLPTPETLVNEKAAATLGIMSSQESLRTQRLEHLTVSLILRTKEGISRLVAEMDVKANAAGRSGGSNNFNNNGGGGGGGGGGSGGGRRGLGVGMGKGWSDEGIGGGLGVRKRDEGYVVESTLLRTLVEHVGLCEENGVLSEENGGLWRRILVRVREGMGIGVGVG